MAPRGSKNANTWTTDEQVELLEGLFPQFYKIYVSGTRKYEAFWAVMKLTWFKAYPEIKTLFPHIASEADLSEDQQEQLEQAIEKRIKQLMTWLRWRASTEGVFGGRLGRRKVVPAIDMLKDTRALKAVEVYCKRDYQNEKKIQPRAKELMEEMAKKNGGKLPRGANLICVKKASAELYEAEDDSVKQEISAWMDEQAKIKQEEKHAKKNPTPSEYLSAIKNLPLYLTGQLEALAERTGWLFSILMGGPQPNANGKISVASLHVGTTSLGGNFGTMPTFNKDCMQLYKDFLDIVYPESIRDARALKEGDNSDEDKNHNEGALEFEDEDSSADWGHSSTAASTRSATSASAPSTATSLTTPANNLASTSDTPFPIATGTLDTNSVDVAAAQGLLTARSTALNKTNVTMSTITDYGAYAGNENAVGGYNGSYLQIRASQKMGDGTITSGQVPASASYGAYAGRGGTTGEGYNESYLKYRASKPQQIQNVMGTLGGASLANNGMANDGQGYAHGANTYGDFTVNNHLYNDIENFQFDDPFFVSSSTLNMHNQVAQEACDPLDRFMSFNPPPSPHYPPNQLFLPPSNNANPVNTTYSEYHEGVTPGYNTGISLCSNDAPMPVAMSQQVSSTFVPHSTNAPAPIGIYQQAASTFVPHSATNTPAPMGIHQQAVSTFDPLSIDAPASVGIPQQVLTSVPSAPIGIHQQAASTFVPLSIDTPAPVGIAQQVSSTSVACSIDAPVPVGGSETSSTFVTALTSVLASKTPVDVSPALSTTIQASTTSLGASPASATFVPGSTVAGIASNAPTAADAAPVNTQSAVLENASLVERTAKNISREAGETRRSARPPIPSKRADLSNKIGDNSLTVAGLRDLEKENIAPTDPPPWFTLAKNHLLSRDLGEDWNACADAWFAFEAKLGYRETKTLPAVSSRPEEWAKWLTKSRNGVQRYEAVPFIADSAELGLAIVKWWHQMQPDFRRSDGAMPTPMYVATDACLWDPLRKSGPNGLASVMTLVVWWGQAILDRNPYQEDSSERWKEMVKDLKECIKAMSATTVTSQKRKATTNKENASKRMRV